jgi:hypothetical protein
MQREEPMTWLLIEPKRRPCWTALWCWNKIHCQIIGRFQLSLTPETHKLVLIVDCFAGRCVSRDIVWNVQVKLDDDRLDARRSSADWQVDDFGGHGALV